MREIYKKQTTRQLKDGMREYKSGNDDECVVVWCRRIRGAVENQSTSFLSTY